MLPAPKKLYTCGGCTFLLPSKRQPLWLLDITACHEHHSFHRRFSLQSTACLLLVFDDAACRPGSSLGSEGGFNVDDNNEDTFGDFDKPSDIEATDDMLLMGGHSSADSSDDGYDNDATFGGDSNGEAVLEWEIGAAYDVSEAS
jgi:hypothetical protein